MANLIRFADNPAVTSLQNTDIFPLQSGNNDKKIAWSDVKDNLAGLNNLSNYYKKTETDTLLANKVDKVEGKGLSTNDYTDADKAIVGGVTSALAGKVDKVEGKGLSTEDYTTAEKNKLAGISANAKNVAISDTLATGDTIANITIDGVTTPIKAEQVTVDSALSTSSENPVQNKVITAELNGIEGAMEESMSGNPIIAECANLPAKELSVALEPIQDLSHGEPSPTNICPISGRTETEVVANGKNLAPFDISTIKSLNTSGTWTDNKYVYQGITWTCNNDGTIDVSGTASGVAMLRLQNIPVNSKMGNITISGLSDTSNVIWDKYSVIADENNYSLDTIWDSSSATNNVTINLANYPTAHHLAIILKRRINGVVLSGTIKVQIEVGNSATPYTPYATPSTATLSFGQTVYGGTVDFKTGKVNVEWGYIASYNGETLPSEWISDRDEYASGTSPTTGAEVAYKLATPTELTLTPQQLTLLKGYNYISADGVMDITFVAKNLPSTPTTDGTYKLIVTVANGVPSFSWVAN